MRLDKKIIIITGASSGIGREMALLFSKEGAKVVAVARSIKKLKELEQEAKAFTWEVTPLEADLTKLEDLENIIEFTMDKYGRIDVLVNNAGIMDDFSPIGEMTDELFNKVFSVNFMGAMQLIRKVIPVMEKQGEGNIINMSSLAGICGARAGAAYTVSKHAIDGLTKNTAYMYTEKGIRCNAICPSGVDTGIAENIKPNEFGMGRIMKGVVNGTGSASPREIADIALFLASDESSFINGVAIIADAGWTAY